ncbi:MAG: DUF493 family protein [Tahibacter sp.]
MRNLDDLKPQSPDQGFQFPGVFELSALGSADAGLEQRVPAILTGMGLKVIEGSLRTRPSREAHYLSVAVSFECATREQYDAAHAALRADPAVRWTI